jgi:hypothetical protein
MICYIILDLRNGVEIKLKPRNELNGNIKGNVSEKKWFSESVAQLFSYNTNVSTPRHGFDLLYVHDNVRNSDI